MGVSESDRLLGLDGWMSRDGAGGLQTPEPMAVWLRHRRQPKRQIENPSWLLSLVTHMAVLIVIGALASAPRAQGHLEPIVITMSLTEGDDEANSSPVRTTVVQSQPKNESGLVGHRSDGDPIPRGQSTEIVETSVPENAVRESSEEPPRVTVRKPVVLWGRLPENLAVGQLSLGAETRPTHRSTASPDGSARNSRDEVVERFIQYDVGRIPGAAGAQALRDFQQLGPDAIPALVRGLNKAATMRASCPIGVISSRLNTFLRQTNDPGMIRYALENIGRGVDTKAPHYRSIRSLLQRLKQALGSLAYSSPPRVVERPRKWWMPDDWQPVGHDARSTGDQEKRRSVVQSGPQSSSSDRGPHELSDKGPGWSTLESLLDAPASLKNRPERKLEDVDRVGRRPVGY